MQSPGYEEAETMALLHLVPGILIACSKVGPVWSELCPRSAGVCRTTATSNVIA